MNLRRLAAAVLLAALAAACRKSEPKQAEAPAAPAAPALKPGEKAVGSGQIGNAMDMTQYAGMVEQAKKTADAADAGQKEKQAGEDQMDQAK